MAQSKNADGRRGDPGTEDEEVAFQMDGAVVGYGLIFNRDPHHRLPPTRSYCDHG